MEPFKKKSEESLLLDEVFVKDTIKNKLNKSQGKERKFTWEGLKNAIPFFRNKSF